MAAMAPALTDASAHPSSFKLPISPTDSGQTGFEATPSNPTSPGLPNGHSNTGHTRIDLDQGIQELELDQDLLLHKTGKEQPGIANHRSKVRLFRSHSQRSRISQNSRLTFLGELDGGKVGETFAFPLSTRAPGLTNGGVAVGNDITKMSHSTATGAYDKQQPCQTSAHTATTLTMPPETSSLSLPNSTDVTGSSSTATADSSEAEDDVRSGQVEIQPHDEMDSGTHQDLDISYDKIVSNLNNLQNTMGWRKDNKGTELLLPELLTTEQISEVVNKRSQLAERAKQLVQKVRCLQAQQITTHTKQQLRNFVQEQRKSSDSKAAEADTGSCPECKRNSTLLNTSDPNVPSTSQRRYSAAGDGTKEQLPRTCYHKRKPLPARHSDVDTSAWVAVKTKSKQLQAKLKHVESWVDSDETESSSGGESCDEGDDTLPSYTQTRQKQKVPLHRRAVWKWAVERASIASRWTWLQAQVSDLEYRIRQQSDIYRQTRASKGVAILGEPSSPEELMKVRVMTSTKTNRKLSPIEAKIARLGGNQEMSPSNLSTLLTNVDQQSARLKRSLQNCVSPMSGLQMPPSATSTPTGTGGKVPFPKPVNGIVGSSGSHRPPGFNSTAPSPGISHKHQGINSFPSSPSLVPTVPEETYCARTRPVWYFRKRKLIRTMNIHSFSRKIQKLSTVRCGCCPPLTPCVMCGGRFNHVEKPKEPDMAPLNERVAQLDFSFHPVLSFPQDIPLSIQFEGMMKSNEWQRKPAPSKQSPMRKKRRPSTPTESKDGQKPKRKYERKKDKDKRRQSTGDDKSLKMLRKLAAQTMKDMRHGRGDGKILKRANSKANSLPNTPKKLLKEEISRRCRTDIKKRRAAQLAIAALKKTRARSLSLPNIKDHFHHNNSMSGIPTTPTAAHDGSQSAMHLSQSMPSTSLQNFLKPRRPGGGSDQYDIDNIVIPYSMLASTRLEKLEYKEIMTPKWRKIPEEQLLAWKNHIQEVNNHEEEPENLSDDEFVVRHAKCEITERQKFLTILANQTAHAHQRRGARRSRNNSQGNTPEPHSPDANLFDQNQPSSVNSSNAPSPLTTQEALSPSGIASLSSSGGAQRSRTCSWDKRRSSSMSESNLENSLQGIFEEIGHIDNPWPMRIFPLEDPEVEELGWEPEEEPEMEPEIKKEPGVDEKSPSELFSSTASLLANLKTDGGSSRSSPLGELLDESSGPEEVEDPNDPEWTVVSPDKQKSSIVLRLTKR